MLKHYTRYLRIMDTILLCITKLKWAFVNARFLSSYRGRFLIFVYVSSRYRSARAIPLGF